MEFVRIGAERRGVAGGDRRADLLDERLGEVAALVIDGRAGLRPLAAFGHGGLVRHAVLRMDWVSPEPGRHDLTSRKRSRAGRPAQRKSAAFWAADLCTQ